MSIRKGDTVYHVVDPRHVGKVERVEPHQQRGHLVAIVVWQSTGWESELRLEDLRRAK